MRDKLSDYIESKMKEVADCYTMERILKDVEKNYNTSIGKYEYDFDLVFDSSIVFYDPKPSLARAIKALSDTWSKETTKYYYKLSAKVNGIDIVMSKTLDTQKCEIKYKEEVNDLSDNNDYYIEEGLIKRRVRTIDSIECDDKSLFNSFFKEKEKLNAS